MNTQHEYTTAQPPVITPAEVYNIAAHITSGNAPKIKRVDAFDLIKRLVDGEYLDDYGIARLYSFFLPPIPAKSKTPEHWVAKAMAGKNEMRNYLQWIYSDGSRLVATDGHRMHLWTTDKYPAGYYDAALNPVGDMGRYPNIDRVIPPPFGRSEDEIKVMLADLETVEAGDQLGGLAYKIPGWGSRYGLNASYVRDALNRGGELAILGNREVGAGHLIEGPFDGCQAVIMPMRLG